MAFKAATCPSCAGALQVPDNRNTVKCMYCGVNVIVSEAIQAAAVGSIQNWLKLANTAAMSGNYQEAYDFFTKVLEVDANCIDAWLGKGEAAGRLSAPHQFRIPEMATNMARAVELVNGENEVEIKSRAAESINRCSAGYYHLIRQRVQQDLANEASWEEFLRQSVQVVSSLEQAYAYAPWDKRIPEGIILVCNDLLAGRTYLDPYMKDHKRRPFRRARSLPSDYASRVMSTVARYAEVLREMTPAPRQEISILPDPTPFDRAYDKFTMYLGSAPGRRIALLVGGAVLLIAIGLCGLIGMADK